MKSDSFLYALIFLQHPLEILARRMTRFCVTKGLYEIMSIMKERLEIKATCVQRAANMVISKSFV